MLGVRDETTILTATPTCVRGSAREPWEEDAGVGADALPAGESLQYCRHAGSDRRAA